MRRAYKDGLLSYKRSDYAKCYFDKSRFDAMLRKELSELRKTEKKCREKQLLKDRQEERRLTDFYKLADSHM